MKLKWKIITSAAVLTISGIIYTWGLPAIVNHSLDKAKIEKMILDNSGYDIDVGNIKISSGWFPFVYGKSDYIFLLNKDNSKAFEITNPKIKINLLPLLWKKLVISNASADSEYINFVLTKDKKILLGDYPLKFNKKNSKIVLSKVNADLGNYIISLDDKYSSKKILLNGRYLKNIHYRKDEFISFNTLGALFLDKDSTTYSIDTALGFPFTKLKENQIKLNATIPNINLKEFSNYANILTKGKIKSLDGTLSYSAKTLVDKLKNKHIYSKLTVKNLAIIGDDKASSAIYDKLLTLNLNFDTLNNGIKFNNTSLESDKIHAFINGKIYDFGKKYPQLDFTAKVKNTRLEDVVAIFPWTDKIIPEFNLYKLKKYVFYGNGEGELKFKGIAKKPKVTGNVKLWDAYLIHPIKGAKENATINLNFAGHKMNINVYVPATNDQSVTVKGSALIDGSKYSELQVDSTDSVVLEHAQVILNPLHEILKFQLGPVPVMKIAGLGSIHLKSAGKKVDPHLWGEIKFRNVTASFNDINNLVLKNGSGEVLFKDTQTTFKSYHAEIDSKPVEIKGDCSVLGKLNVYITSKGHNIPYLIKVINSSPILFEVQNVVKPFTNPKGIADIFLHIYGTAKDAETIEFNKDLFSKGTITFHNASTILQDTYLPFTNINGVVNFDKYDSDYDVNGYVRNSKIFVKGTGSNSDIDLVATSDKFKIQDCTDLLYPNMNMPYQKEIGLLNASFVGYYKGSVVGNQIDYDKVKVDGKFLSNINSSDPITLNGGNFTISNGNLSSSKLNGTFYKNPFNLTFTATNIYDEMKISDATFNFKDFDVSSVNAIKDQLPIPQEMKKQLSLTSGIKGKTDISGYIKNEKIYADTDLQGLTFVYNPLGAPVRVLTGEAKVRGDYLYLNRVNTRVSAMPLFLNGKVSNIYVNPSFDLSISAKPTQQFFDNVYNSKSVYPLKLKGDVNLTSKINGTFDALRNYTTLNIGENSSVYFMGATIEGAPTGTVQDATNPVSLVVNSILYPNKIKINAFNYNQTISSQNKRKFVQNQLNANGEISLLPNNVLKFNNFKIKTNQPVNAKIFNVITKKPTIKQGVFTTDLLLNGTSLAPNVLGFLNISSIDIPLFDSTIRDINVDFDKQNINVNARGTILTNDIIANAKILNKTTSPYIVDDLKIQFEELNLNNVTKALNDIDADNTRKKTATVTQAQSTPAEQVIINKAVINADKILIEKALATDFTTHMSLNSQNILDVDNFNFKIANGTVDGKVKYDLSTFKGAAEMNINNADAEIIAENFFDMPGQMYGLVTGSMKVGCTGLSGVDCVNTLNGEGNFKVENGKMPKLGSLEYLLKAGNLITGGITGLSINGIIDLITPLKTGNFDSISGDVKVVNGVANEINIYSSGKDLNMYLTGSYNISTLVADMEVYGSLSKNFSTLLGKIGNASLNRLFNAIPGITINEINPKSTSNINKIPKFDKTNVLRVFKADIYGDINGSNYVKSFRWIRH